MLFFDFAKNISENKNTITIDENSKTFVYLDGPHNIKTRNIASIVKNAKIVATDNLFVLFVYIFTLLHTFDYIILYCKHN